MTDLVSTSVSGVWAIGAAVLLGLLALYAATVDSVMTASSNGRMVGAMARPLRESARLMRQRRRSMVAADSLLWRTGGSGLLVVALLMAAVVPLGDWTIFDLNVGIVWFNAMDVVVWALVWLAGWGPNSTHSLVGGYRFLALGLAYELPLMFALVAPAAAAGSLNVGVVASAQESLWFVVWMPVAFVAYCAGVLGFAVWGPFAAGLGADIAGGVGSELSGVDRLLFLGGRYALLAAGAAFAVPMFLGGGAGPLLPGWGWALVKTLAVLTGLIWVARRVPLFRPDLFVEVGWVVLLPAVLLQDLVVGIVAIWRY